MSEIQIELTDMSRKNMLLSVVIGYLFRGYYEATNIELREAVRDYYKRLIKESDSYDVSNSEKKKIARKYLKTGEQKVKKYTKDFNEFIKQLDDAIDPYLEAKKEVEDMVETLVEELNEFMDSLIEVDGDDIKFNKLKITKVDE